MRLMIQRDCNKIIMEDLWGAQERVDESKTRTKIVEGCDTNRREAYGRK